MIFNNGEGKLQNLLTVGEQPCLALDFLTSGSFKTELIVVTCRHIKHQTIKFPFHPIPLLLLLLLVLISSHTYRATSYRSSDRFTRNSWPTLINLLFYIAQYTSITFIIYRCTFFFTSTFFIFVVKILTINIIS